MKILAILATAISIITLSYTANAQDKIIVSLAGSSACQTYNNSDPILLCGWGEVLGQFFKDNVEIKNFAMAGRSTKTFIKEGLWDKLLQSKPNYILMTLGANDAKKPPLGTDAQTEYKENLTRFIKDAQAINAKIIFVTLNQSVGMWNGKLCYNSEGKVFRKDREPYVKAMTEVAEANNLPCLDLFYQQAKEMEEMGEQKGITLYRYDPVGKVYDPSHTNRKGAEFIAGIIVKELLKSNSELKQYVKSDAK